MNKSGAIGGIAKLKFYIFYGIFKVTVNELESQDYETDWKKAFCHIKGVI